MSNLADELEAKIVAAANQQARSNAELAFNPAHIYAHVLCNKHDGWEQRMFPIRARIGEITTEITKLRDELCRLDAEDRADKMRKQVAEKAATVLTEMLK